MLSRFDDTTVIESDVILTTKRSYQKEILVRQLVKSAALAKARFDFRASPYFSNFSAALSTGGNRDEMVSFSMEGPTGPLGALNNQQISMPPQSLSNEGIGSLG